MRKNFGPKTWLYPMPVLIVGTYDENGSPNAMNAAWGGIYDTSLVMVCLADDHTWTVAHQAPLSIGSPRQGYRSRLPFPCLLNLVHWQVDSLPLSH